MTDDLPVPLLETMPLCDTLGFREVSAADEAVTLELDWAPGLCTTNGLLHGGAIMALADSAGALCAFAHLPRHATGTATIESKTNFLRGVTGGTVRATATPLHVGSTTIVVETAVHDDAGRLVAKVTQTQAVLAPRAP
jgi:1,4-dihydroxy-2-naphthoyl-CoA hydrolase